MIVLLYGFGALGTALYLRDRLVLRVLDRPWVCINGVGGVSAYSSGPQWRRDYLLLYEIEPHDGDPAYRLGRQLRGGMAIHVYTTCWPDGERERLFAYLAPRLKPCVARWARNPRSV